MRVRDAHDQRIQRAHLLVKKSYRIVIGVVGAETIRADHFGEPIGLVCRSGGAAAPHLAESNTKSRVGELPGGLGSGEATADYLDVEGHDRGNYASELRRARPYWAAGLHVHKMGTIEARSTS